MPPPPPWPRPVPPLREQELKLDEQSARVSINGVIARTKLKQTFINTTGRTIEGTYLFPLPKDAAIGNFALTLNGKRLEAEILEGDKAREIYNGIVARLRDPAIFEFIDRGIIRARLFPIPANEKPVVELEYVETLRKDGNGFRYQLPQRLAVGGAARQTDVDITIKTDDGIRAVYSPTHELKVTRDGNTARATGEWKDSLAGRDLTLYISTAKTDVGLSISTFRQEGEPDYFVLLAAPDDALPAKAAIAKDVVFVCDTSGSMSGEKIEQARRALQTLIGTLSPTDQFGIVTFSSDTSTFREKLVPAGKAAQDAARGWVNDIKALGGTNINDALETALGLFEKNERPKQIVFLTDGLPTVGERDPAQILKNVAAKRGALTDARLFTFGVGYDVNTKLLDALAEENRGTSDYVAPEQDIELVVGALGQRIAAPVMTNLKLNFAGAMVNDVYPKVLPDIFRGSQLVVFGRIDWKSTGVGVLRVSLDGTLDGKAESVATTMKHGSTTPDESIARLWATRKIGFLLDDARRSGLPVAGEVKDEIVKLSRKWGIVTPLTAGLITEDEAPGTPQRANSGGVPLLRNAPVLGQLFEGRADRGAMGAAGAPSASDSGTTAFAKAKSAGAFRRAETVDKDAGDVSLPLRATGGKSFILKGDVWTDLEYDPAKSPQPKQIKFGTNEYFALLRDPRNAKWLAIGERVLWVNAGQTIEIVP